MKLRSDIEESMKAWWDKVGKPAFLEEEPGDRVEEKLPDSVERYLLEAERKTGPVV